MAVDRRIHDQSGRSPVLEPRRRDHRLQPELAAYWKCLLYCSSISSDRLFGPSKQKEQTQPRHKGVIL